MHVCIGVCALRGGRVSRQKGDSTLCKYSISCLSAPHVCRVRLSPAAACTPGDVFPEMLREEKVEDGGAVGPAPPAHPTPFIPSHTAGGGKPCHGGPLQVGIRR